MKKKLLLALLAFVVAGISIFFVWLLLITYVMRSMPSRVETSMAVSLITIAACFFAAAMLSLRENGGWLYRAALAVMLVAGIGSFVLDQQLTKIETANRQAAEAAERQALEAKFESQFDAYRKDVAERVAAKKPLTPREAQAFLDFVQGSDLGNRSLPDHSPETFALLKQALDGKVLDPNARVKGPRAVDVAEEPLFVGYYKFYLQSGLTMPTPRVREREWKLFQMLVAGGANLSDPAAAVLKDNVTRETAPYDPNVPGHVTLK